MKLGEYIEKFGRTLFEAPLATGARPDEPPELAEIRLAVIDTVKEKSYRSGARKVFPFDLLLVELRGIEESQHGTYSGRFFRQYLEQEVRQALRTAGCRFPENLRVDVDATAGLPPRDGRWLAVSVGSLAEEQAQLPPARLVVRDGLANTLVLHLDKARTNIGRVLNVYRAEGLYRRNDLSFEAETEINKTVSREHAHIQFDRTNGEYRLFNDRWHDRTPGGECGTWVVRDGMSQEVHRTPRGMKLQPGDEIHFGRAVVTFEP
jgi:hypothetical protein